EAAIIPKINAPIKKFYVDRGSKVHAGQLLAELEDQDLQGAVTENRGGYEQAQAAYEAQVQKAQQDLRLAKEQLDNAQSVYESRKSLFQQGAASGKDVDDAQVALTQAQNQYQAAQKQLDVKAAQGQLQAARGKNQSAVAQLSYTRITSPISGVVTDRPVYPGEMAPAGSPIITVMDTSQVVARAHVSEDDAKLVKKGDAATLTDDSGQETPGKVVMVGSALDPANTTVEVWVQAPNPKGSLKPGASVHATIVVQTVKNALVIPAASVLTSGSGATSVMVLDADNHPSRQDVKIGIHDADHVQVLEGLQPGERVVTVGAFELDKLDKPVLAKTKIQVQAPKMEDEE
ncbi:MAG TPA: efflux RND transporter periplasmic adaptor subunit, partial [Terriglobales bacterium]|nr:efflux RND transporter periplasmic adaptor subunit [Terriglobales bacterium]